MGRVMALFLFSAWLSGGLLGQEAFVKQRSAATPLTADVTLLAVSEASGFTALTTSSRELVVLNESMGQVFSYPQLPAAPAALFFTPEGSLITARVDGQVTSWDLSKGTMLTSVTAHKKGIANCLRDPRGRLLIAGTDNSLVLYDPASREVLASTTLESDRVTAMALHPNGTTLAVGLASNRIVLYDSTLTQTATTVAVGETPVSLRFGPKGTILVCGTSGGTIRLWETRSWIELASQAVQRGEVTTLAIDPGQQWIASVSADSTLVLYAVNGLRPAKTLRTEASSFTATGFLSSEIMITGTSAGAVTSWQVLERAPDTTAPTLTILRPARYTEDAPSKVYAKTYEVSGVVYDENRIQEVLVANVPARLEKPTTLSGESGLQGREFHAMVPLASVGMNSILVTAKDSAGNTTEQTLFIRRLTMQEAVEIQAPAENAETEHVAMEVEVRPWFDVVAYTISVNTIDLINNRSGVRVRMGDVIREEVPLIVGYNQIGVTLVSKEGERFTKLIGVNRKFSAAITETVRREPGVPRGTGPQRWAVIVGVSEYANKGIPSLKYADRDAEALAAFLQTPEGGGFDADHMRVLVNKDATLSNLREAMIDFLQQAIDKDLVIVYFAGHGAPDPTRPQNLYLLTHDTDPNRLGTTAFPMWDIQTVVARQIAAKKVVVLSDACHSGGISVDVATRGLDVTQSNPINQYLAELARAKDGLVVFTASAAGEVSQEFPELGHGVFTYYLLEGLKGAADANNDYLVTVNEMMGYVEEQVKRKTRGAQNPTRSQTSYDKELPMSVLNQ